MGLWMSSIDERGVILFNPRSTQAIGDSTLPMGLIMAASHIAQRFRVKIIDQRLEASWPRLLRDLLKQQPVCMGVTAMTGRQIIEGLKASRIAARAGCSIVWGGVHASLLPAQTVLHPLIDYVVEGEGEETLDELVQYLAEGRDPGCLSGVWTVENGVPRSAGPRALLDLNLLPETPYDLVDLKRYIAAGSYGPFLTLYTSRGCPQRCTFCYNYSFNKGRWRAFSPERVLEDIERLTTHHPIIEHVQFWDDNFFAHLGRARQIAQGIARRYTGRLTWSVLGAHVRELTRMDDAYLEDLRASGLKEVVIGVESGSQKVLERIRKNFLIEELLMVNRRLARFAIRPTYSFLSGVPGETHEDVEKTVEVMFKLKSENDSIHVGTVKPFIPYPGTELYQRALELGFRPPAMLEEWGGFVWSNYLKLKIPWVSKRQRRFLACLYYYSVLINPEYLFIRSSLFSFGARLLRPIALWRLKRLEFRLPLLAWIMHWVRRAIL